MRHLPSSGGSLALTAGALLVATSWLPISSAELPVVRANDNRAPAGVRRGDVHTVNLVVRQARWFPEGAKGPSIVVEAIGEAGRAPRIPAPLLRVRTGATIAATVRNALPDSTITVYGLQTRPATTRDSIRLAPGESRTVRFAAGAPGTYLYQATIGRVNPITAERETAAGAFVVDSAGGRADDQVFVINIWGDHAAAMPVRNALAINGQSWPHTERLTASLGDSVRYRVVNASIRPHPIHLHGFYFRVDARGDGRGDTTYAPERRRLAVTEELLPSTTMRVVWHADRPGNWLLHCHFAPHVVPEEAVLEASPHAERHALSHDANQHMVGLVMGITVREPRRWREPVRTDPERLRLLVQEGVRRGRAPRAMGYVLQRGDSPPAPDSIELPGSVLVVTRGRPTDITVVNRLKEPTGVHWHGIELESYSDGVVGWSGSGRRVAPPIAPGDSFVARLTLPRAGTFMYHTHLGDLVQLTSGLYGAIVVLEPGQRFDPRADHVFVVGWDGFRPLPPRMLVNGDSILKPVEFAVGERHRLRFVNIGAAAFARFALRRDTSLVRWRAVAKDGADLPAALATERPAFVSLIVGQTYDAEFDAREPGEYTLTTELFVRGQVVGTQRQKVLVR